MPIQTKSTWFHCFTSTWVLFGFYGFQSSGIVNIGFSHFPHVGRCACALPKLWNWIEWSNYFQSSVLYSCPFFGILSEFILQRILKNACIDPAKRKNVEEKKTQRTKSNRITSTMEMERDKRVVTADAGTKLHHWYLSSSPAFPQYVFVCVSVYYSIIVISIINLIGCICHTTETAKSTQNTRKILNGLTGIRKYTYTTQTQTELQISTGHNFNRKSIDWVKNGESHVLNFQSLSIYLHSWYDSWSLVEHSWSNVHCYVVNILRLSRLQWEWQWRFKITSQFTEFAIRRKCWIKENYSKKE